MQPHIFVPKGDKIRVRLDTDYTELNKHVKRPIHPFSSTQAILQAVPKEVKVFAKLDAVHEQELFLTDAMRTTSQSLEKSWSWEREYILPDTSSRTKEYNQTKRSMRQSADSHSQNQSGTSGHSLA